MSMICVQPTRISTEQNQNKISKTMSKTSLPILETSAKNESVLKWIASQSTSEKADLKFVDEEKFQEHENRERDEVNWSSDEIFSCDFSISSSNLDEGGDVFKSSSRKSSIDSSASKKSHKLKTIINWVHRRASVKSKNLKRKASNSDNDSNKFHCSEAERISFSDVIHDKDNLRSFREFLVREMSVENLEFWLEVEAFRKLKLSKRRKISRKIFETYIASSSAREINIDCKTRREIEESLHSPGASMFDCAQAQIYELMKRDSFHRFSIMTKQMTRA